MLLKLIRSVLPAVKTQHQQAVRPTVKLPSWLLNQDLEYIRNTNNRYPPRSEGLSIIRPELMIEDQHELITEIAFELTINPKEFNQYVIPTIENFAKYVQLLPASKSHHHASPGGLFRHSLEVGLYSAKAARGMNFTAHLSPSDRFNKKPKFIVASFLVGLMHDIGKPFSDVVVTSLDTKKKWDPTRQSLFDFAVIEDSPRIFYSWTPSRHRAHNHHALTTLGLDRVVGEPMRDYLTKEIFDLVFSAITGLDTSNDLARMMLKADSLSTKRDLRAQDISSLPFTNDVPIQRYIIEALRQLAIREKINTPGARIWVSTSEIFINFPAIFDELLSLLDEDCRQATPRTPDEVALMLIDFGVAVTTHTNGHPFYCTIYPTILNGMAIQALQLSSYEILFPDVIPAKTIITFTKPNVQDNEDQINRAFEEIEHKLMPMRVMEDVVIPIVDLKQHQQNNIDQSQHSKEYISDDSPSDSSPVIPTTINKIVNEFAFMPPTRKVVNVQDNFTQSGTNNDDTIPEKTTHSFDVIDRLVNAQKMGHSIFTKIDNNVGILYPDNFDLLSLDPEKSKAALQADQMATAVVDWKKKSYLLLNPQFSKSQDIAQFFPDIEDKSSTSKVDPEVAISRFKTQFVDTIQLQRDETGTPIYAYMRNKHFKYLSEETGLSVDEIIALYMHKGYLIKEEETYEQYLLVW